MYINNIKNLISLYNNINNVSKKNEAIKFLCDLALDFSDKDKLLGDFINKNFKTAKKETNVQKSIINKSYDLKIKNTNFDIYIQQINNKKRIKQSQSKLSEEKIIENYICNYLKYC